ncbi:MAG: 30S ribosomal protein S20 [Alphaproteobacteria bacterium CG11_big_fil_rev_8_21_14_0_20_44_7]|nr:MAG: 30S ribosomal protein S20 [Alphaproteobacteria bacterium CG11_big_fil_rev_8_21_14_0_20_44_7]
MANTSSAKIIIRQIAKRTTVNRNRTSRMRTFIKKVETAIEEGDAQKAQDALRKAESEIARGVQNNIIKKNTAARRVSRLSARIKALGSKKKVA